MNTLGISSETVPAGLGTHVVEGACGFRVWAPNALSVSVVGPFNDWNPAYNILTKEEGGTWSGWVNNVREGTEYRYFIRTENAEFTRADPVARKITNSVGNSVIWTPPERESRIPFEPPTLDQLVVYELHIGSFHVPEGQKLGTFATAMEKLPYLKELGVNAVEIMPVAEFAGDFSWGYNPAHPYAVESAYGGPEAMCAFVERAHELGIAVIVDVVYNHFGPSDLDLWQFDGWSENGKGGIYFYNDHRAETPWGATRPDYGRGEVRSYLRNNALMWFHEFNVDGLRWDMSLYIRTCRGNAHDPQDDLKEGWGLMQWINDEIHKEFPRAITIAEDLQDSEWIVKATGAGGAGFNTQWDGSFVHPIRSTLIVADDNQRSLDAVIHALKVRYDGDAFKRVVYSESHDEVANGKARLPSEINPAEPDAYPARKRSLLGAALVFTAPGVPMLFQGQEFLEDEWFRDNVPVDWTKQTKYAGILAGYRDLVRFRANLDGIADGLNGQFIETHHVDHEKKVLGYHRWREGGPGDDVIVLMNFSHATVQNVRIGLPRAGQWKVRYNSDSVAYGDDFGNELAVDTESESVAADGYEQSLVTNVGPYSVVIFSQDRVDVNDSPKSEEVSPKNGGAAE